MNLIRVIRTFLSCLFFFLSVVIAAQAQQLAFPGAEGFGKHATGGRGGVVIEVTNLYDAGPGSLRAAVQASGPRTIVFRVSGTIFLESKLSITHNDITIAGQTAPGEGICIANYNVEVAANNVIIRYLRVRLGDNCGQAVDAFTVENSSKVIVDHCSFSWSVDEAASCYLNTDFTMQYCIISESLYHSIHPKGDHGYGGIWGGSRATFHHNLIAHHTSRLPRFNGARYISSPWNELVDYRNNLIYNWGFNSAYGGEASELDGIKARINMVGNYYKPGPATNPGALRYRILEPSADPVYGFSNWHIDKNYVFGSSNATTNNWQYGVQNISETTRQQIKSLTPFPFDTITEQDPLDAYSLVLSNAGAILPRRDTVDGRVVWEVANTTATYGGTWGASKGIIDSEEAVGGWPELFSAPAPLDSDHDGMPDQWELASLLDPLNPSDGQLDGNHNGYTNLEDYLNSMHVFPTFIHPPSELTATLTDIREISLDWKDNSADELGFVIERNEGSGFYPVDTLDQNAIHCIDSALSFETTYQYRLRAISAVDSSVYSNFASSATLSADGKPLAASEPFPADESIDVPPAIHLSWKKGVGATAHILFFGITDIPDLVDTLDGTVYQVPSLIGGVTYYWRVDEMNGNGTTPGPVWSFAMLEPLPDTMVGYWQLDGGSPTPDSSGFSNHGNLINLTDTSFKTGGAVNNAVQFNGIDQYIRVPHNWMFNFSNTPFSLSFWMNQDPVQVNAGKEYRYLIKGSHLANSSINHSGKRYEVYYKPASNQFRFCVDDDITKSEVAVSPSAFVNNSWVHVVAIRDKSAGKLQLYANKALQGEALDNTGDISQTEDLFFGYCVDYGSHFEGFLDDIRLYNFAITSTCIDSLFNLGPYPATGIRQNFSSFDFYVFPNPAADGVWIRLELSQPEVISARLKNMLGEYICYLGRMDHPGGELNLYFNLPAIKPGVYMLQIESGSKVWTKRLLILNK